MQTHGLPPVTLTEVCTGIIYRIRSHVGAPDLRSYQQNRATQFRGDIPRPATRYSAPPLMSYAPGRRTLIYNRINQSSTIDRSFDAPRMRSR